MKRSLLIIFGLQFVFRVTNAYLWPPFWTQSETEQKSQQISADSKTDVTITDSNSSFLIVGAFLFGGLLIASIGLYALDVYATARIDEFLLEYYGPQAYEQYTNYYQPTMRLTATTENDYYGYRSLYGLRLLGWLEQAYLTYGATEEVLNNPVCQKRLICEIRSTPKEDKTWLASKIMSAYEYFNDNEIIYSQLGHREACEKQYPDCQKLSEYEERQL